MLVSPRICVTGNMVQCTCNFQMTTTGYTSNIFIVLCNSLVWYAHLYMQEQLSERKVMKEVGGRESIILVHISYYLFPKVQYAAYFVTSILVMHCV